VIDQILWRAGGGDRRELDFFLRASAGPGDRNQIDRYLDTGLTLKAPLASRPDDTMGFLGQGLSLSVTDFLAVIQLLGVDPFERRDPVSTLSFVKSVQAIVASPFSIAQLSYIYRCNVNPNVGIAPLPGNVNLVLTTLQAGLAAIAQADVVAPDPKGDLILKNLGTLLGTGLASIGLGLINGTGVFSVALAALPSMTFPPSLASSISYDSVAKQLRFIGPMSSARQTTLLGLSGDVNYQAAVQNLRQQQVDFISTYLLFLPSSSVSRLIDNAQTAAENIAYVTQYLMPYLRRVQSQSLVTQTLCDDLGISSEICGLLLNTVLNSQVSPGTATAMSDFLALVGDGLTASYYSNINLAGVPVINPPGVDPAVDFDWGFGLPPNVPNRPFSVKWTGWVMPQYSESYTFYVNVGDGVHLVLTNSNNNNTLLSIGGPWAGVDQPPAEASGSTPMPLTAGQLYPIELDWYDDTAPAQIQLSWSSASTPKVAIPQSQLFSGGMIRSLTPIVNSYILLYKAALLITTFPLTAADVAYFQANDAAFAGNDPDNSSVSANFDWNLLPLDSTKYSLALFNQWQRLNAVVGLRKAFPGGDAGLLQIFGAAASGNSSTTLSLSDPLQLTDPSNDPLTVAIAQVTGWNATDLVFMAGNGGFNLTYADFTNERGRKGTGLTRLQACVALLSRLGISAQQLFAWASFDLGSDVSSEEPIAEDIQKTFKARYDDSTWITVGKPLNDQIRSTSKDALIAYILGKASAWNLVSADDGTTLITTSDQLYEFFLIDVDMSTCMLTSRIVQASAAIQLFVERCLMNLESTVSPPAFDTTYWQHLKNFRVWQAAKRVFFYPEDYMVPTLRDDMTPFFEDLEAALLQNPVTADTVEQAYLDYLTALDTVSRLDIRATYWQYDATSTSAPHGTPDASNDVLHVFARTTTTPYVYYYRRLINCSQYGVGASAIWRPWEVVDLGIQGDHLVPVVWDRRLFLFWPSFVQSADPSSQSIAPATPNQSYVPTLPSTNLQVSISWSEYKQGTWTSKSSSATFKSSLTLSNNADGSLDTSVFYVTSNIADDTLTIYVYLSETDTLFKSPVTSPASQQLSGFEVCHFTFPGCGSAPSLFPIYPYTDADLSIPPEILPFGGIAFNSVIEGSGALQLVSCSRENNNQIQLDVLGESPYPYNSASWPSLKNPYNLMFPQQFYPRFSQDMPPPFSTLGVSKPFFYQDSQRIYFVTGREMQQSVSVLSPIARSPYYLAGTLMPGLQLANGSAIFETAKMTATPPAVVQKPAPAITSTSASASAVSVRGSNTPVPDFARPVEIADATPDTQTYSGAYQLLFSIVFHPLTCAFIKTLNRYGVPQLLSLATQTGTNDNGGLSGGVLSGFVISPEPSGSGAVDLSPGILVTTDQNGETHLYQASSANVVQPPPRGGSNLYYNPQSGFYYGQSPIFAGDAFIGSFVYPFAPPWTSTGPTMFEQSYDPNKSYIDPTTFPRENVDFTFNGAYSIYNWELFFHIPLLVATQLSQNQQFQDADQWFRYIFDPTSSSPEPSPQRYWTCLPFRECSPDDEINGQIQTLLMQNLQNPGPSNGTVGPGSVCGQDITYQINAWMNDPFDPFMIGRMRMVAFRMKVVMAYLDNLVAWGDSLFAQNTRESINEATQLYVRAKALLGPRPVQIPQRGTVQDYTYNDLVTLFGISEDDLNNPLVMIENDFPYISAPAAIPVAGTDLPFALSMSSFVPYFCLPPNDTLLGYWDTVDDRLYKIRHCMNIQGVVEQLPLFAPPIPPALLVAAEAAGVDLSSVISNTNAAVGFYRFNLLIQKALELCAEVRSLGTSLLAALEKQDGEALALLRATQETSLFQAMQQLKAAAVQEAQTNVTALQASLQMATDRQSYYQNLISNGLIGPENAQAGNLSDAYRQLQASGDAETVAAGLGATPSISYGINGAGGSPSFKTILGVQELTAVPQALARYYASVAALDANSASSNQLQGQWSRRAQEWIFQQGQASDQMAEIQAQITAAGFRLSIAQYDQQNLDLQIRNAQAMQDFLTSKYTNTQLYNWMVGQISTVFFQCYQMAYDLATRAEAAFRFERCLTTSSYITFGYWDSLKKGLMSGERLYADLKRLDIAYLETDVREFEISRSVSLVLFDSFALITLKETGLCVVNLPEAFFDMDYPGHYFRRLKTVSLTIPCVTGPYTSVNCTLTLLNSKIRVDTSPSSYASDAHFITNYAATQAIATSTAQNDSGMFEVNFRDERYLPFEGAGLISTWQIEMPPDCNAFDFDTITDIVINLRYTARHGGDSLKQAARKAATLPLRPPQPAPPSLQAFPSQPNLQRLFSLRHEFPTEWYKFLNPPAAATSSTMSIGLTQDRFPFQYRNSTITIAKVEFAILGAGSLTLQLQPPGASGMLSPVSFSPNVFSGALYGCIAMTPAAIIGVWILQASGLPPTIDDILMICDYSATP
jgi:hypothetical protein